MSTCTLTNNNDFVFQYDARSVMILVFAQACVFDAWVIVNNTHVIATKLLYTIT